MPNMKSPIMYKLLFVCTGNICRSPTLEAIFRKQVENAGLQEQIHCDSAAMTRYHVGEHPDSRTIKAARKRGFEMESLTARAITPHDYQEYNLILGADHGHVQQLTRQAPNSTTAEIALFLQKAGITHTQEIPDPYYAGAQAFEQVLDLAEEGCALLLDTLRNQR